MRLAVIIFMVFFISGCAATKGYVRTPDQIAESDFYSGNIDSAIYGLEALAQKKDKDYALWKNQLGSAYLVKGDYDKAELAFLDAFYLMNNVSAFKELERSATSLMGAESNKAYKGDPYEKMYNSFYTGMLLLKKGDLDNARAAFKNGILCDSDSSHDRYKSDELVLFLLSARLEHLSGNKSLGDDFLQQAKYIYRQSDKDKTFFENSFQEHQRDLKNIQSAIVSVCAVDSSDGTCDLSKMSDRRKEEISRLKELYDKKTVQVDRAKLAANEEEARLFDSFLQEPNNLLLIVESGKGPTKSRTGKYGERAVIWGEGDNINELKIFVDGQLLAMSPFLADVYYQATTRGGRRMDSILRDKAQFKEDAAKTSETMLSVSNEFLKQGNQTTDPNARAAAAAMAGISALGSGIASLFSHITNPEADIRHWSFLPNKIRVYCVKLPLGTHRIEVLEVDGAGGQKKANGEFRIDGGDKNNVVFLRLL